MKKLAEVVTHRDKDGGGTEDQHTNFIPDLLGRPVWTVFPDATSEFTGYEFDQVNAFKNRNDKTRRMHYDARGREDYETWDGGVAPRIDRQWDAANRLSLIWNSTSTIDFKYDDAGQMTFEADNVAGSGARVQTTYYRYASGEVANLFIPVDSWCGMSTTHGGSSRGCGTAGLVPCNSQSIIIICWTGKWTIRIMPTECEPCLGMMGGE
jgi:hypothetical protein